MIVTLNKKMENFFGREPITALIAKEIVKMGFYLGESADAAQGDHIDHIDHIVLEIFQGRRSLSFKGREKEFLAKLEADGCDDCSCMLLSITGGQRNKKTIEKIANRLMERFELQRVSIILGYDGPKKIPLEKRSLFETYVFA